MNASKIDRFKKQLTTMQRRLAAEIGQLVTDVQDDGRSLGDPLEVPSEAVDKAIAVEQAEEGLREQVDAALQRIADGTFGTCHGCAKPIPEVRIKAIPYALYCIVCETARERQRR